MISNDEYHRERLRNVKPYQLPERLYHAIDNAHLLGEALYLLKHYEIPMTYCNLAGEGYLHLAARRLNLQVMKALITVGCDLEQRDLQGRTPLWLAVTYPFATGTRILLEAGANPHTETFHGTPLVREVALHLKYSNSNIADTYAIFMQYVSTAYLKTVIVKNQIGETARALLLQELKTRAIQDTYRRQL